MDHQLDQYYRIVICDIQEVKVMADEGKPWYKSKTIWVNVIICVAGVFEALQGSLTGGGTLTIIGVANIVLRIVTNSALVKSS